MLHHGGHGVAFHHGLARVGSIVIRARGVDEFLQVKTLVLKRVRQLMGQNHLLHFFRRPVGDEHRFAARVVGARGLFGVEVEQELRQIELARDQAESFEHGFLGVDFLRRVLFAQTLFQVFSDFGA